MDCRRKRWWSMSTAPHCSPCLHLLRASTARGFEIPRSGVVCGTYILERSASHIVTWRRICRSLKTAEQNHVFIVEHQIGAITLTYIRVQLRDQRTSFFSLAWQSLLD